MSMTGGLGPSGKHGNRTWGDQRPGTRAYAMAHIGWAAFDECKQCQSLPGEPCKDKTGSKFNADEPCRKRKLVR